MARAKQFDPDEALERAMVVFRRKGFAATSMQDLVDAMGIGRGSIYETFGSKQVLFVASLRRYHAQSAACMEAQLQSAPRAMAGIEAFIRGLASQCCSTGRVGCMLGNTAVERSIHDPESEAIVAQALQRTTAIFASALRRAQEQGDFPAERDPRATARFLVSSIQGLTLMAKADPDPGAAADISEEVLRALR